MPDPTPVERIKVVLCGQIRDKLPEEIRAVAPHAEVRICSAEELEFEARDATIIASTKLSERALAGATKLQWVHSWAAGPDEILTDAMKSSPVLLTSCKGNGAVPLAEHAIMMMLMLDRDARRAMNSQSNRAWDRFYHGELNGKTCGIIGAGNSGVDLAQKAKAFHMRVVGLRRRKQRTPFFDEMYDSSSLGNFLAESDFVVVGAALTPETLHMLGTAEFRQMKSSAYYVCYSRGSIADPSALEMALRNGWIAGAGLDAHDVEPLPINSPLWTMPNVIITAHLGALSTQTRDRGFGYFLKNLRHFMKGEPMVNLVDKKFGY